MPRRLIAIFAACMGFGLMASPARAEENAAAAEFDKTIQPILESHCYDCHADGLDKGHVAHGPKAVIEVGELTPIDALPQAELAQLPEVIVSAPRLAMAGRFAKGRV